MVSEIIVATMVDETQMTIQEGMSQNYGMDIRKVEFAVIDKDKHKAENQDFVIAIPQSRLTSSSRVQHKDLPFDIELLEYYENSRLVDRPAGKYDEATSGWWRGTASPRCRPRPALIRMPAWTALRPTCGSWTRRAGK